MVPGNLKEKYQTNESKSPPPGKKKTNKQKRKTKKKLVYINIKSDHPLTITKRICKSIAHRLATNSNNINIFNKAKMDYETVFKNREMLTNLKTTKQQQ